jgi:hypothetical protein
MKSDDVYLITQMNCVAIKNIFKHQMLASLSLENIDYYELSPNYV